MPCIALDNAVPLMLLVFRDFAGIFMQAGRKTSLACYRWEAIHEGAEPAWVGDCVAGSGLLGIWWGIRVYAFLYAESKNSRAICAQIPNGLKTKYDVDEVYWALLSARPISWPSAVLR